MSFGGGGYQEIDLAGLATIQVIPAHNQGMLTYTIPTVSEWLAKKWCVIFVIVVFIVACIASTIASFLRWRSRMRHRQAREVTDKRNIIGGLARVASFISVHTDTAPPPSKRNADGWGSSTTQSSRATDRRNSSSSRDINSRSAIAERPTRRRSSDRGTNDVKHVGKESPESPRQARVSQPQIRAPHGADPRSKPFSGGRNNYTVTGNPAQKPVDPQSRGDQRVPPQTSNSYVTQHQQEPPAPLSAAPSFASYMDHSQPVQDEVLYGQ